MTSCFSSTERLHTVHATYRLPELPCAQVNRTGKLPPNSPNLHAIDYSLWGVATDGVLSQNFRSRHDASHRRSRRWDIPYLESDVSKRSHVAKTVSSCFAVLRQLRSIRRSVSRSVLQSLVSSLVLPRLHYSNATLVGIPSHLLSVHQSVMNAALIFSSSRFDHITPLLRQLHWLKA